VYRTATSKLTDVTLWHRVAVLVDESGSRRQRKSGRPAVSNRTSSVSSKAHEHQGLGHAEHFLHPCVWKNRFGAGACLGLQLLTLLC